MSSGSGGDRIDALVAAGAARSGDRVALAYGDRALTYAELTAAADALRARLPAAPGSRVAVIAPNAPALVVGMLAAWRAGAVAVPLGSRLREYELTQILRDAAPVAVVSVEQARGYSFAALLRRLAPTVPTLRTCVLVDDEGREVGELDGAARPQADEPLAEGVAAVLYTSGTTGRAKGTLVTHEREVRAAPQLAGILGLDASDAAVFVVPIAHAFGLTCLLAALGAGARAVLVASSVTPRPLLDAVAAHGARILHGSPALFVSLLKATGGRPPRTLRTGFVAGAPCPPSVLEQLDDERVRILDMYGATELGAATSCRADDAPEVRYETVGRPLAGIDVRLADGEVLVRGPGLSPGYLNLPEQTAASFAGGWFHTGDLGEVDAAGNLRVSGRAKDVVHVGGFSVFPAEVEGFLLTHPDVEQAAVLGVEREPMGEALHAFVVPRPEAELTAPALLRFARASIADYKLPYGITLLPELPLLPSGKPDRAALRRLVAEAAPAGAAK